MRIFKLTLTLLLTTILLAGCSGGGDSSSFGLNGTPTSGTPTSSTSASTATANSPAVLALGTGAGSGFQSGALNIGIGTTALSVGGQTSVSVNVVDTASNALYTAQSSTVSFTSTCASQTPPKASITPGSVISQSGSVSVTYASLGCTGTDTITASLSNGTQAQGTLTIASQTVGSINFTSATPSTIALKGAGTSTIPETSTLVFTVKDTAGNPVSNATVDFSITSSKSATLSVSSAKTDSSGIAKTVLSAGSVKESVSVKATVNGATSIAVTSLPVTISTGVPDQNSFQLSANNLNPLAYNINNVAVKLTINVADFYKNPVPDGTSVSFMSESGGQIDPSCTTVKGVCSVNWVSAGVRPLNGILSILATTVGEETVTMDANGNGLFDLADKPGLHDLPEAYLDRNENGKWDPGEIYLDRNGDGSYSMGNGVFDGARCAADALAAGNCPSLPGHTSPKMINVRSSIELVLSGTDVTIKFVDAAGATLMGTQDVSGGKVIYYIIADGRGNIPASGSTVEVTTTNGKIAAGNTTFTVPSFFAPPNSLYTNHVSMATDGTSSNDGFLSVKITLPNGASISKSIAIKD